MHELSIAQALVDQAQDIAKQNNARQVTAIIVAVGALSGVDHESLKFVFPMAAEGTVAEKANLIVETVPAQVLCHACNQTSNPDLPSFVCPKCGSDKIEITGGRELILKSVDVDVD
jgi:hydrogenase nickel incorporation protein HypA/HybF